MRRILVTFFAFLLIGSTSRGTFEERLRDAALSQPSPWYAPGSTALGALETPDQYAERVTMATRELALVTDRDKPPEWRWGCKALAVAVLAHWYEESRFALEVHEGIEHPVWTQDKGRARCLGQLHVGLVPEYEWQRLAGLDEAATRRCALWTARALTRMAGYCRGKRTKLQDVLVPMFSGLGGGGCSPTASGRAKAARFAKMWREVER